jgi:hypothetical protein
MVTFVFVENWKAAVFSEVFTPSVPMVIVAAEV